MTGHRRPIGTKADVGQRLAGRCAAWAITAALIYAGAAGIPAVSAAQPEPPLELYVLMGQSNMAGRAPLAGLPRFRNAGRIEMFRGGAWKPAAEPVGEEADDRVGPALSFADALLDLRQRPIGLVPCAKGGTKIDDWRADDAPASLFGACLAKLKAASARGRLAGILFYQGEYDTWRIEDAEAWPDKFKAMIEDFRRRAGAPDAPVVFTQIGPRPAAGDAPAARLIALQGALRLRNGAMVSATDLPFQEDRLHLTQNGQLDLGRRYAGAMGRLLAQSGRKR